MMITCTFPEANKIVSSISSMEQLICIQKSFLGFKTYHKYFNVLTTPTDLEMSSLYLEKLKGMDFKIHAIANG